MKAFSITAVLALASSLLVSAPARPALADQDLARTAPGERAAVRSPNRRMLRSGIWTLGLAYAPAALIAGTSERPADTRLFVPVAGPWMNLADRGPCGASSACDKESFNKAMLVTDGIFQGLGALQIVSSFLFPETRSPLASRSGSSEVAVAKPRVKVMPARLKGGGYGVAAQATFF